MNARRFWTVTGLPLMAWVVATTIRPRLLSESSTSSSEVRLASRRDAPGKLGEVVGDHGTLRMEPLRVGGERRGIRRTRELGTPRTVATVPGGHG